MNNHIYTAVVSRVISSYDAHRYVDQVVLNVESSDPGYGPVGSIKMSTVELARSLGLPDPMEHEFRPGERFPMIFQFTPIQ